MTIENPERRARSVALIGLVFQTLLTAFLILLAVWTESQAMRALALLTGAGVGIWVLLLLIYHQRVLVQEEAFETEELKRQRAAGVAGEAIFAGEEESLLLARRRLRWMYRWLVPVFAVALIVGLTAAALTRWSWSLRASPAGVEWTEPKHSNVVIWFMGGAAFLSFLLSRYAVGMARQREWQMLRAGASYLMGVTLACVAMGATLAALQFMQSPRPEHILAYVLRYLMLVLAAEFTLNQVLDFYRPRMPDEEPRPAFDSRLLGLFTEPGGIARSIADAINYQFGFEVSSTWFYKLLERSAVPLAGFAAGSLLLASSLAFVAADEEAVLERFGRPLPASDDPQAGPLLLGPGLHLKYPWPIDRIRPVGSRRIHELQIGTPDEDKTATGDRPELLLWTNKHMSEAHVKVLVASPRLAEFLLKQPTLPGDEAAGESPKAGEADSTAVTSAVSVSMLRVAMTIQYRIRDVFSWLNTYRDPEGLLKAIAGREITRTFASVDVIEVLGPKRGEIESTLAATIRERVQQARLGIDILFVGLQGVHPPEQAAEKFQEVIGAEWRASTAERTARGDYNRKLAETAGSVEQAEALSAAIVQMNRLEADPAADEADRQAARRRVQVLLLGDPAAGIAPVSGEANSILARARAERWRIENEAHKRAIAFEQERAIHQVIPEVYRLRKYLTALAETVKNIRKYAIATQGEHAVRTFHLDIKDPMNAPMDVALEEPRP